MFLMNNKNLEERTKEVISHYYQAFKKRSL